MVKQLPVVAAVPNYNMADNLRKLLPQLIAQHYDAIFVLDDVSTDHSADVVSEFGDEVKFVRADKNGGAAANRNQIIGQVDDETIIHFIDADMDLQTSDTPAVARETFARYADRGVGMIGGLVCRADGNQEYCNYGAVFSLCGNFTSNFPRLIDRWKGKPRLARAVRKVTAPMTRGWPNVLEAPAAAPAYWLHEGNMLVYSSLFRSVGGYDATLRCHEAADLAIRMDQLGVKRQFDPAIKVVHLHIDVRGKNRNKWANTATRQLIRKHGLRRFLTAR
jgi:GT2 family glycosyltransferase